jgi:hypothetical protein
MSLVRPTRPAGKETSIRDDSLIGSGNKGLIESLAMVEDIEDSIPIESKEGISEGKKPADEIPIATDDEEELEEISDVIFHEQNDTSTVFHV